RELCVNSRNMDHRVERLFLLFLLIPAPGFGQPSTQPDSTRIRFNMLKPNFLGSVSYIADDPDDENTRIITNMANEYLTSTAYLSMTRGDGGQNLIGPEIREK